ncbi:hypothetical protein MMC26_006004 [Xylographa opegraphella]|nr:hypothetical protein [Xylographa opegraphella]
MATIEQSTATTSPDATPSYDPSHIPRGPVTAPLKFFDPPADGSKPFNYPNGTDPPEGLPRRNFGDADILVPIHDIRGREAAFSLDDNAFQPLTTDPSATATTTTAATDFASDEAVKAQYYPEVERLLRASIPGVSRVFLFDHTVRPSAGTRPPVLRAHIDQSATAAVGRVRHFFPDEAADLLRGRVRIINVWRPLNGPVQCSPLAVADSRTVRDDALVVVEHRYADRTGETLSLQHAHEQWYYWSGMQNHERLLLQCFDSEKGARVPHTAFVDPRSPVGGKERESIEVRALVFG